MNDPQPTTPDPTAPAAPPPEPPMTSAASIKETIESILVAFILAFVFRAFIVEAFVIPTGSMAPTLMGAHMRFVCEDCGYQFDTNFNGVTGRNEDDVVIPPDASLRDKDGRRHEKIFSIYCPNCGFHLTRTQATSPSVHYGDRILVLKYAYLINEPRRWDVVVFKSPYDPKSPPTYQTNYIKRLVGKPGEQIMILDGDIYTRASNSAPWTVQPKPRFVQNDLWRPVYDNDYYPRQLERDIRWRQPWTLMEGGGGWDLGKDADTGRSFRFDNLSGSGAIYFDRNANRATSSFTDWLAYNFTYPQQEARTSDTYQYAASPGDNVVSDLRLAFYYTRKAGEGPIALSLEKLGQTFVAELTPGRVTLYRTDEAGQRTKISDALIPHSNAPAYVEFMNVDYQVSLYINGQLTLQTTPDQYAPDMEALMNAYGVGSARPFPRAQIIADRQTAELSHISLSRDIYYINRARNTGPILHGTPDHPAVLGADEYFVLGDNSALSLDARYWSKSIDLPAEDLFVESGRVPGRFMLGKAFFVYWPSGFRASQNLPAIVPNFGDMRFIH